MPTFDAERLTAFSESSPRVRGIDTLQYHHAATMSLDDLESGMEPGGREVSANCALDTDGTLILKVPIDRRAFTSGVASYDQRCITVETVNTSGAPEWGISDASHRRLGKLAAEMFKEGLLSGLFYGTGGIIGHRDVPGTYATACPGPSYNADLILKYANEYLTPKRVGTADMQYISPTTSWAKRPTARIITDFRNKELVTDPARVAALDYSSTRTNGLRYEIYDEAEWNRVLALPDFGDVKLSDAQLVKIGSAIKLPAVPTAAEIAAAVNTDAAKRLSA